MFTPGLILVLLVERMHTVGEHLGLGRLSDAAKMAPKGQTSLFLVCCLVPNAQ